MKNKNIVYILLIALALTTGVYFYLKNKKNKEDKANATPTDAVPVTDTTGGASTPVVVLQPTGNFPLQKGSRGKLVQIVQIICKVKPDGNFGNGTDIAVRKNMASDGIVTQKLLYEFATKNLANNGTMFPLKLGTKNNNYVKAIQVCLGITADGNYGAKTQLAVQAATGKKEVSQLGFQLFLGRLFEESKK